MPATMMFVGTISIDGGPPRPFTATGVSQPLGTWGGVAPPYVDIGFPADQPHPSHPIYYPRPPVDPGFGNPWFDPRPSHPIVIVPPGAIDGEHPSHPITLPVYPTHPIVEPPTEPPSDPSFIWVYTDQYGWVLDPVGGGKPRPPGRSNPSP